MDRFTFTCAAAVAAFGALLVVGPEPALSSQGTAGKDQARLAAVPQAAAEVNPASVRVAFLSFSDCLGVLADMASEARAKPVSLVSTDELRIARIQAEGGFVTVACSRSGRMVVATSEAPIAPALVASR